MTANFIEKNCDCVLQPKIFSTQSSYNCPGVNDIIQLLWAYQFMEITNTNEGKTNLKLISLYLSQLILEK